jgi:hypothetical protein
MRTAIEAGEPGRRARDAIEATSTLSGEKLELEARWWSGSLTVRLDGRLVLARGRMDSYGPGRRGGCGRVIRRRRRLGRGLEEVVPALACGAGGNEGCADVGLRGAGREEQLRSMDGGGLKRR